MDYTVATARRLPAGRTGNEYCVDMLDAYDYTGSLDYKNNHESFDQCAQTWLCPANERDLLAWYARHGGRTADVIASPAHREDGLCRHGGRQFPGR